MSKSMTVSFSKRVSVPADVLMRELDGEAVLLHLGSDTYFGLNDVGTRMWQALTTAPTVGAAYEHLLATYDVAPDRLQCDLLELTEKLVIHGLLQVSDG